MIIALVGILLFLFTVFQLSKDDFLFIRKGVTVEQVFNTVFLTLPVALLSSRLFYVLLHPSWKYLNPFIFFIVPYFPGLSLVGGIVGAWIFITLYTKNKKIPSSRLLDMISLSFLLSLSVSIVLDGIFVHNRIILIEEIVRGVFGIFIYILLIFQFIKGAWVEGSMAYFVIGMCCLLSALQIVGFYFAHLPFFIPALIVDSILFIVSLSLFLRKQKFVSKLLGK